VHHLDLLYETWYETYICFDGRRHSRGAPEGARERRRQLPQSATASCRLPPGRPAHPSPAPFAMATTASRPQPPGSRKPTTPINTSAAIARGATARSAMSPRGSSMKSPTGRGFTQNGNSVAFRDAPPEVLADELRQETEHKEQVRPPSLRSVMDSC
jgi:hypothetical protein